MLARYITSLLLVSLSVISVADGYSPLPTDQSDALAATALAELRAYVASSNQTCTIENAAKRREWWVASLRDYFP